MENKEKSFDELIEETKKLIKAFVDALLELTDPIVQWLIEFTEKVIKAITAMNNKLFSDKKNKKNNKRLHRIKRNLVRRGTEDEKHIRRFK